MISKEKIHSIIEAYGQAWVEQDSKKILTIFTPSASYQEGPFALPMIGHDAIGSYWDKKVVKEQKNITFVLKSIVSEESTAVAEWNVAFDDLVARERVELYEVAFIEFQDNLISSYRETWRSKRTPL